MNLKTLPYDTWVILLSDWRKCEKTAMDNAMNMMTGYAVLF
jgi:tRNA isopentenyl-2-thiomethyl-A-37 hydroxylase MiaE